MSVLIYHLESYVNRKFEFSLNFVNNNIEMQVKDLFMLLFYYLSLGFGYGYNFITKKHDYNVYNVLNSKINNFYFLIDVIFLSKNIYNLLLETVN